jgi:hypothetical protein
VAKLKRLQVVPPVVVKLHRERGQASQVSLPESFKTHDACSLPLQETELSSAPFTVVGAGGFPGSNRRQGVNNKREMNAETYLLNNVEWQFFCTFTFKSLKVSETVWLKMFFALMSEHAENFGVHFSDILWALRYELGEMTQRPHFHAIMAGSPASAVTDATCFSLMRTWEKLGGGQPRVRVYDSHLPGVEYVLKGVDEAHTASGANWYELGKFGGRCQVMLSMSLIRHLQNRKRFGHRDRDGLFKRRLGFHARRRLKLGDKSRGTDTPGTHSKA